MVLCDCSSIRRPWEKSLVRQGVRLLAHKISFTKRDRLVLSCPIGDPFWEFVKAQYFHVPLPPDSPC